jgi:5-methylcytosine-specific restriction endonuclease McrA
MSVISSKKSNFDHNDGHNQQPSEMNQFFMRYWRDNKEHNCEVCNVWLGSNPLTYMFDHVLEKSKYPHLAFEEENIMYLCLHCHDKKTRGHHSDVTKERIEYLKNKFKI